jgi:hypothetical protein
MRIGSSGRNTVLIVACIGVVLAVVLTMVSLRRYDTTLVAPNIQQGEYQESHPLAQRDLPAHTPPAAVKEDLPDVFGVVEDDLGNPLRGAVVRAILMASNIYDDDHEVSAAETLTNGTYSHNGFALGNRYRLTASAQGFVSSSIEIPDFKEERTEINFVLTRNQPVRDKKSGLEHDELKAIISGATASLAGYRSGRILYTMEDGVAPTHNSAEQIQDILKRYETSLKEKGFSEDDVRSSVDEYRATLEEANNRTEWTHSSVEGEYVFEGENLYVSVRHLPPSDGKILYIDVKHPPPLNATQQRYINNGRDTVVAEGILMQEGKEVLVRYAEVGGPQSAGAGVDPPFRTVFQNRELLTKEGWRIADISKRGGGISYTLENTSDSHWSDTLEISPEKQYTITEHRGQNINKPNIIFKYRYNNLTWDAATRMYYPREVITEGLDLARPNDDQITYRKTYSVNEAVFNIDIPDETFVMPYIDGLVIKDYRFHPPKTYTLERPEWFDEYMNALDNQAAALDFLESMPNPSLCWCGDCMVSMPFAQGSQPI